MPNGSLQQHLHSPHTHPQPLEWSTRLRIALDCARALEFLHENVTPSIIHRDFKCSNILLDHSFRAKVSDFGLAKTGSNKINGQISTRVLGTTGYLAPEWVLFFSCPAPTPPLPTFMHHCYNHITENYNSLIMQKCICGPQQACNSFNIFLNVIL